MAPALIAHCRAGFEPEAAADLVAVASTVGTTLEVDAPVGGGLVVARPAYWDRRRWQRALDATTPVFVRSLFVGSGPHALFDVPPGKGRPDRVAPLVELVARVRDELRLETPPDVLFVETADTNEGKELSGLGRALSGPLDTALRNAGLLGVARERGDAETAHLHILLVDGMHVHIGVSQGRWASPWPMGIPRLRMPNAAPSRSALKLAEAFLVFLGERETELLRPAMHVVDLGAAPGGWSWQLAHRGLRVTAVDNGPLKGEVATDPLVTHLRTDGLSFRPRRPVDWLVCDIADQPVRIATLVARWLATGDARRAIFNLKLPMKKRWDEVQRCRELIATTLTRAGVRHELALRQLYHDREEVTGYCARAEGPARRGPRVSSLR